MVARKDKHVFAVVFIEKMNVLVNGVCGTLIPLAARFCLIGRKSMDSAVGTVKVPRLAAADILV